MLLAFHKPYGVLSQFTPEPGSRWRTLADFGLPPRVYPLGRLDADSEGLLLLTTSGALADALTKVLFMGSAAQALEQAARWNIEAVLVDKQGKPFATPGLRFVPADA